MKRATKTGRMGAWAIVLLARLGEDDPWNSPANNPAWNDGEQIREKFIRHSRNIGLVLCGRVKGDGAGRLSETDDDTTVLQLLANYQFLGHGGMGWLRILKFRPREKTVGPFTCSPWPWKFREEEDQPFTAEVPGLFA